MSIVAAFGDDDHTAADGPYARVLKVRKWLYVFSACAFLLYLDLYNDSAVLSLLKVISLPTWFLSQIGATTIVYLVAQYFLLCWQLIRTYDIVLGERLSFRRSDELARASALIANAETALDTRRAEVMEKMNRDLDTAQANYNLAQRNLDAYQAERRTKALRISDLTAEGIAYEAEKLNDAQSLSASTKEALETQKRRHSEASERNWITDDPRTQAILKDVASAHKSLADLTSRDPAARPQYRGIEIAVDVLRIAPPPIVALWGLANLMLHAI